MSNYTDQDLVPQEESYALTPVERYVWVTGITLSAACLVIQAMLFVFLPKIRKLDQKILAQLAVARFVNTLTEYLMGDLQFSIYSRDFLFALYVQTDAVLVCWMFIFTKNLYDKVVQVFVLQTYNFLLLSVLIWLLTIPLGVLCPVFLSQLPNYFDNFYKSYAILKFVVLFVNVLFFCNIFYVIITRNKNVSRHITEIIKTSIISFLLVCVTSLQVLVTDLTSFFTDSVVATNFFCLVNSFQVIAITAIFVILVKNAM